MPAFSSRCSAAAGCAVTASCELSTRFWSHTCVLAWLSSAGSTGLAVSSQSPRAAAARMSTQNSTRRQSRSSRGTSCELRHTHWAGSASPLAASGFQDDDDTHTPQYLWSHEACSNQVGDLHSVVWCAVLCCALLRRPVSCSANNIGSIKGVRQGGVQQQQIMMVIPAFLEVGSGCIGKAPQADTLRTTWVSIALPCRDPGGRAGPLLDWCALLLALGASRPAHWLAR